MTWGLIIGGSAAALGGVGSALIAKDSGGGSSIYKTPVSGYNPLSDSLLSALSLNALSGVGSFDPNVYRQASPSAQILAQAQAAGNLNQRQYRYLQEALAADPSLMQQAAGLSGKARNKFLKSHGISKQAAKGYDLANRYAVLGGYGSYADMLTEQQDYLSRLQGIQEQYQPTADVLRKGILSSQTRTGEYLQNLPSLLTGDKNPFIDDLREEALMTAQKYGVNPYNLLEDARSTAMQRVLQLIGAEQQVVGTQQQGGLNVAALRSGQQASAAQIGASQAQALAQALGLQAQLASQSNLAQAQIFGELGGLGFQGALIGADMYGNRGPATGSSQQLPASLSSGGTYLVG